MPKGTGPQRAADPARTKQPGASETPDVIKHEPVSWGLARMDLDGDWSWLKLDPGHLAQLHAELVKHEGETLYVLLQDETVKDVATRHLKIPAKNRLKEIGLEEKDTLWELRLPGKWRAWGLMERSVFHFLWWDPNETACNPPPKGERRR